MGRRRTWDLDEAKVCTVCGSEFRRADLPRRISSTAWAARLYCSASCRDEALARRARERSGEQHPGWRGGREAFLARQRTGQPQGRPRDHPELREAKLCERCGVEFERPRKPGYHLSHAGWEARRFCSDACRLDVLTEEVTRLAREGAHPAFKGDNVVRATGNRRARELYPELGQCNRCPAPAELRHHVDDDTLNNEPENVEFLCRPCHIAHHDPVGSRWSK